MGVLGVTLKHGKEVGVVLHGAVLAEVAAFVFV